MQTSVHWLENVAFEPKLKVVTVSSWVVHLDMAVKTVVLAQWN